MILEARSVWKHLWWLVASIVILWYFRLSLSLCLDVISNRASTVLERHIDECHMLFPVGKQQSAIKKHIEHASGITWGKHRQDVTTRSPAEGRFSAPLLDGPDLLLKLITYRSCQRIAGELHRMSWST